MVAVLVFLSIDGDKIYISALARSFELIPVNEAQIHLAGPYMLEIATYLFTIGVQIASPFIIVLFLLDVSLAGKHDVHCSTHQIRSRDCTTYACSSIFANSLRYDVPASL
jgi:hypothetical protein